MIESALPQLAATPGACALRTSTVVLAFSSCSRCVRSRGWKRLTAAPTAVRPKQAPVVGFVEEVRLRSSGAGAVGLGGEDRQYVGGHDALEDGGARQHAP